MKSIQAPRGFRDINSKETAAIRFIYNKFKHIADKFNFTEIITPSVEQLDLFKRTSGEFSDIVNKEMFLIENTTETLSLKPEGTAGMVRYMINQGLFKGRFFTFDKFFRKERPQKGRYREFFSLSVELIGRKDSYEDIECLKLAIEFFKEFDIDYTLNINNIGSSEDRQNYSLALKDFFQEHYEKLSPDSKFRFDKKNFLRILDSKTDQEIIEKTPRIQDFINSSSKKQFEQTIDFLKTQNIKYKINPFLVRGLDYYNGLVFEFVDNKTNASQSTFCGGGRYDNLFGLLGGQNTPAVGFGIGVNRITDYVKTEKTPLSLVILDDTNAYNYFLADKLRKKYQVEYSFYSSKNFNKNKNSFDLVVSVFQNNINLLDNRNEKQIKFSSDAELINHLCN